LPLDISGGKGGYKQVPDREKKKDVMKKKSPKKPVRMSKAKRDALRKNWKSQVRLPYDGTDFQHNGYK